MIEWSRLVAIFWLAVHFWAHLFARLFRRRVPALPLFEKHYRPDGIWPVREEDRAAAPDLGECVSCRLCDPVCPSMHAEAGKGFVGPSRLVMADSRLLPAVSTWLAPFLCIRCRACDDACPQGVAIDRLAGAMRAAAYREARELVPRELRDACERVAAGGPLRPDGDPRTEQPGATSGGAGDYVLLSGCAASRADREVEAALLARAGVSFSAGPGICCGAFEASAGAPTANARTRAFLAALAGRGTFQVATGDARCYAHLRAHPQCRRELQVTHVLELAHELRAASAAGEPEEAPKVTYHDPCQLVREPGGAEIPREALRRAGAELVEMPRARRDAPCCGMAGGTWTFNPELAEELGRARIREARATGASILCTQSPLCRDHLARCAALEAAADPAAGPAIEVQSVEEFLARRAGVEIAARAPARGGAPGAAAEAKAEAVPIAPASEPAAAPTPAAAAPAAAARDEALVRPEGPGSGGTEGESGT